MIIHASYIIVLQLGDKFLREKGFKHVRFLSADGALESYPPVSFDFLLFPCTSPLRLSVWVSGLMHVTNFLSPVKMGMADAIVDLVSSGTTLRENNLKEIDGGVVLESQVNFLSHTPFSRQYFAVDGSFVKEQGLSLSYFLRYQILCRPLL